jgi:hypothetical protein
MQFEGHGAVFGNVDLGGDVILPGAFKRTLAEHKANGTFPAMFWMHDQTRIPGKWLDIAEDDRGLPVKGALASTDLGKEVHTLLKMDAVGGLSIGYRPAPGGVEYDDDGVRLLKEVQLFEVSIVAIPMNPKAQVAHVKSRLSARGEYVPTDKELAELKREAEQFLRSRGFSKAMAKMCATNLFHTFDLGAMLGADDDQTRDADDHKSTPSATPDELEVAAGLSGFKERLLLQDLNRSFHNIFKR